MEKIRELRMVFNKSSSGYSTPRAIIPKTIVSDMGISPTERNYILEYDSKKKMIIIKKQKEKINGENE